MIRRARANWRATVIVCAKCEKKLKGRGFGPDGDKPLSKLLRKRAGGKGRKAAFGVVAGRCLSICPKRAVTVVDAARPRDWLIVGEGTPLTEVAVALGLPASSEGEKSHAPRPEPVLDRLEPNGGANWGAVHPFA